MTDASTDDAAYFASVVAEIEAEAQRRTDDGDYPRALLRSLDEEFRRWIPATGRATGVEDAIRSIEAAAYVDPGVPVESNKRVGRYIKTGVRKATYFYHRHMAQQIAALGIQITRPMRLLDATTRQLEARVATLEDLVDVNVRARDELLAGIELPSLDPSGLDAVSSHLGDAPGRVLVGEITDPTILSELRDRGVDAYGTGPGASRHNTLELRSDELGEHLSMVGEGELGGVVMLGVTDRLGLNEQLRLLSSAVGRLRDEGRVVVVVTDPDVWREAVGPVAADLLRGRPLHRATWAHLLQREGATVDSIIEPTAQRPLSVVLATLHR